MQTADILVLFVYFFAMIVIGIVCAMRVKKQEDFFMGGRGFGKLLQTFAAFGAGTGSQEPINVGRTTWTSGLSGVWSALMWLFVTPFYWIFAVWYRRMRHITIGDWFVERYESRAMGAAYTVFGFCFYIAYLSTMFSAIAKVASPLLGEATIQTMVGWIGSEDPADLRYILIPAIAVIVVAYGVVGGLAAAYWTDLIQGLGIILLSILLIPYGLSALVEKYGDDYAASTGQQIDELDTWDGFSIMHQRVSADSFQLFGGPRSSEFPLHYIISLSLLGLVGIVVQPHFITTGGGTARSEQAARIGLVTGNFLKRFCTIGWAITALIVVALLSDSLEINQDPDLAWGVATREILGNASIGGVYIGLVGLMLACLLAALMSSADCNMLVASALLVRNVYAPYFNPNASEKQYITAGRIAGFLIIFGASWVALESFDVFAQYKFALEIAILFAAPFWVGMFWRRATTGAAWGTIVFSLAFFFVVPYALPAVMPSLRDNQDLAISNDVVTTTISRLATPADIARRQAEIALWGNAKEPTGEQPAVLTLGDTFDDKFTTGGQSIFWGGGVDDLGEAELVEISREESEDGSKVVATRRKQGTFQGKGRMNLDYYLYHALGMDLRKADKAMLQTLRLPPRMIMPFLVMILLSLVTRPGSKEALDRYYVKMKTPVDPEPENDLRELELSYATPSRYDHKKMFPNTSLEIQKPTTADVSGFVISIGICVLFLLLAMWLANIGS
ncbi:MAG: hypothetical protein GXP26_04000 [Planctomycetes bacterium]|nr:hypothetical protein [Planctomycetota bacterium]